MKKLRFLLLAAIVLATFVVFSLCANAEVIASGNCGDKGSNVKYSLDSNGTLTIYGSGKIKDVDGLYNSDFVSWDVDRKVKSIVIKDGITEIGIGSFASFSNLESVTMADSVTKIGEASFFWNGSLKEVRLSKNLTEIRPFAFSRCSNLEYIELPNSLKIIDESAFFASGLKSITIPEGVTTIGGGAFADCKLQGAVVLPESLTTIGEDAFNSCGELQSFRLPKSLDIVDGAIGPAKEVVGDNLVVVDGVTFTKDMKTLVKYPYTKSGTSYTVPNSVETIASYAFYNCTNLTSLQLSENLINIHADAFYGSVNIKELVLPPKVMFESNEEYGTTFVRSIRIWPENYFVGVGGRYIRGYYPFANMNLDSIYVCGMDTYIVFDDIYANYLPAKNVYILKDSATDKSTQKWPEWYGSVQFYVYYEQTPAQVHYFTPHTHSYTSAITKSATCTSTGTKKFTCSCGDTYTETIAKAEHTCDKWFVLTPAKAGAEGRECGICNVCGAVAIRSIAALPKDRPVFRLTSTETENGYAVTLSLENNVNGFYSLDIMLKYDTAKLKCVETDTSNAVAKFEAANTNGTVLINYADTAFFANKGELCTIYFEPAEDIPTGNTEVVVNTVVSENPHTAVNCTIDLEKETAPETTTVIMTIGQAAGFVSGKAFALDAAPIIRNDRTMLPVRFVAEAFGAEVGWDGATSTASIKTDDVEISITIGATTAIVNGEEITLDSPAFIENSRTYLPVRFVAEKLGASVQWDGASSTATLTK